MRAFWLGLVGMSLGGCAETVSGGAGDGGPADSARDVVRDADLPRVDLCGAPGIVDANAAGLPFGRATIVRVDADALPGGPLPPSGRCPPPSAEAQRRLLLRYTPPVDGFLDVVVRAIDAAPGDGRSVLTSLRDGCDADATELACTLSGGFRSLRPDARLAAGQPVYVVASLAPGRWSVTLRLSSERAPTSASCEDERGCVAGNTCVLGRCLPDGALLTFCRAGSAPCDAGLACMELPAGSGRRRCLRPFRLGERCDPEVGVCTEGICARRPTARCLEPGLRDAPCRLRGAPCDAGLVCSESGWCVEARAPGAVCAQSPLGRPCPPDESCVGVEGGARCVRDGARGGACLPVGVPRCEAGLRCAAPPRGSPQCMAVQGEGRPCDRARPTDCDPTTECLTSPDGTGRCVRRGAAGTTCDPTVQHDCDPGLGCNVTDTTSSGRCGALLRAGDDCSRNDRLCPAEAPCARIDPAQPAARCARDGARGAWCRAVGAACDEGLACSVDLVCLPRVAEGEPCSYGRDTCAPGLRCAGTCRREGAVGGYCRLGVPTCNPGGACRGIDHDLVEQCVPSIPLGDVCGTDTPTAVCAEGGECVAGPDRISRCTPRGAAGARCLLTSGGGAPCGEGLVCSSRLLCEPPLRAGEECGFSVRGECVAGLTCVHPLVASRCAADGSFAARCRTTGAPCDPGLTCEDAVFNGEPRCVQRSPAGAACDNRQRRCAEHLTCVDGACLADGAAGRRCRASERPCDGDLRCVVGRCTATVATGCSPRGPACAAPAECLWDGSAYTCARAPYAVEVRRGVAFEDPCMIDGALLTSPLRFRLFGVDFDVAAGPRLIDPRPSLTWMPHGVTPSSSEVGCAALVGAAPNRRLLLGGGAWAMHTSTSMYRPSNAVLILHEGSNVIEYRYADPILPQDLDRFPAWGSPTLEWTGGGVVHRVTAPHLRLDEGLSVRFTPQ